MATDLRNLSWNYNNDATLRALIAGFRAQLEACGLVRTSDTGQVDPATVNWNNASYSLVQGYEIYRLDDPLQATAPVFIKIEYGNQVAAFSEYIIWVTVGTSTNGAGTIGGKATARSGIQIVADPASRASYVCGDGSGISVFSNVVSASQFYGPGFHVDRTRDGDGEPTADGIEVLFFGEGDASGGWPTFQAIPFAGTVPSATNNIPFVIFTTARGHQPATASDFAMMPLVFAVNGKVCVSRLLIYPTAELTALTGFDIDHLGDTRHYMPFDATRAELRWDGNTTYATTYGLAIPWE